MFSCAFIPERSPFSSSISDQYFFRDKTRLNITIFARRTIRNYHDVGTVPHKNKTRRSYTWTHQTFSYRGKHVRRLFMMACVFFYLTWDTRRIFLFALYLTWMWPLKIVRFVFSIYPRMTKKFERTITICTYCRESWKYIIGFERQKKLMSWWLIVF